MSVGCMCICETFISTTEKHIILESLKILFKCMLCCNWYLESFTWIGKIAWIGTHIMVQIHYGVWENVLTSPFKNF